jgi:hypothetical protein
LAERAVWPMAVVALGVLGQHGCDVPLIEDQGANSSDSALQSPVDAENSVTPCDLQILVEKAAEAVSS